LNRCRIKKKDKIIHSTVALVGYALSPLSWWNDAFINIPIAYVFAAPFRLISKAAFLYSFILIYWATNIIGLLLLQKATAKLAGKPPDTKPKFGLLFDILMTIVYTVIIAVLVHYEIIQVPFIKE